MLDCRCKSHSCVPRREKSGTGCVGYRGGSEGRQSRTTSRGGTGLGVFQVD